MIQAYGWFLTLLCKNKKILFNGLGSTEMVGATHAMANDDLTYGACGVPFHSVKYYLRDWKEAGYLTTDKPNPRGEIVVGGDVVSQGYYKVR